jgi:asparagine synthase (glutamine-hydrolysing)
MWPGSYHVIILTPNQTVVIGDLAGRKRIYYVEDEQGVVWTTAATPLAALIGSKPSLLTLAVEPAMHYLDPYLGATPFPGVSTVPPGSMLVLQKGIPRIRTWFEPEYTASFTETSNRLRATLQESVRLRSVRAVCYSGGIDSGTLAALSTLEGAATGITYTDSGVTNDDLGYAQEIQRACPGLRHEVVVGGTDNVMLTRYAHNPATLPMTDLPDPSAAFTEMDGAIFTRAQELGLHHLLNGEGGDNVLYASPLSCIDMYRAGSKQAALRWMMGRARASDTSAHRMVTALLRLTRVTYIEGVIEAANRLARHRLPKDQPEPWERIKWVLPATGASWLTPTAAKEMSEMLKEYAHADTSPLPDAEKHAWYDMHRLAYQLAGSSEHARSRGITLHYPFFDNNVVATCLALPGWKRQPYGTFKPLITKGMKDLLPSTLTSRRTKGSTNSNNRAMYQTHYETLLELVRSSRLVQENIMDGSAVETSFQRLATGLRVSGFSFFSFLSRELWLNQLDLDPRTWWEEEGYADQR